MNVLSDIEGVSVRRVVSGCMGATWQFDIRTFYACFFLHREVLQRPARPYHGFWIMAEAPEWRRGLLVLYYQSGCVQWMIAKSVSLVSSPPPHPVQDIEADWGDAPSIDSIANLAIASWRRETPKAKEALGE